MSLTGILLRRFSLVTRQRRRVTRQIYRLARVFVIVFARNHIGRRAGFLLESLSIPWVAMVNDGASGPWLRAASQSTNKLNETADRGREDSSRRALVVQSPA